MLANFLEKSKPINFIVYLGLFFCFLIIAIASTIFSDGFTMVKLLETAYFLLLFLAIFFFYNFVVSKNKLTFDHSYAFFLFILTTIIFVVKLLDLKTLVLILIHLFFLRKIYSLRSPKSVIKKLFDSGFWLGILFILEPFSIVFSLLIFVSILLQQKITINTLATPIIGFITPLIIYFTYVFWNDSVEDFTQLFYFDVVNNVFIYAEDQTIWIFGTILLLTLLSVFIKSPKALSVNNSFKRSWIILMINALIAVIFALLIPEKDGSEVVFLTIPASIIIANGFEVIQKELLKNILFGLFLVGTILTFIWL